MISQEASPVAVDRSYPSLSFGCKLCQGQVRLLAPLRLFCSSICTYGSTARATLQLPLVCVVTMSALQQLKQQSNALNESAGELTIQENLSQVLARSMTVCVRERGESCKCLQEFRNSDGWKGIQHRYERDEEGPSRWQYAKARSQEAFNRRR